MSSVPLPSTEQILGIRFFNGTAAQAVETISAQGGLVVAPSGTCFARLEEDADYRRAIFSADIALADSGLMVSLWRLLQRRDVTRISGLTYLKTLLQDEGAGLSDFVWVLPNERARDRLIAWSMQNAAIIPESHCYIAPFYGPHVTDPDLLALLDSHRPRHVVIAIGAGAQEKLGWFLRENAAVRPAIHCIGGALGFITGDQVAIPDWADRLYLGWFLRLLSQPRIFIPRLWKARRLLSLMRRHGAAAPPFHSAAKA